MSKKIGNCQLCLFLLLLFCNCKKEVISTEIQKIKLEAGFGSNFELQVALPPGYNTTDSYGMIFLLDAEWLMEGAVETLKKLNIKDYVIVGLAYAGTNNRANDFTPTLSSPGTGKAPSFASFIESDIIYSYMRDQYPNIISDGQQRVFIGYSLGGLFGTYLFLKNSKLFGRFLLISSSYMTDAQSIFGIEKNERAMASQQEARIYFATGSLEEGGFHSTVQHFSKILSEYYPHVSFKNDIISNAGHTGVRGKAIENGLSYLLRHP